MAFEDSTLVMLSLVMSSSLACDSNVKNVVGVG